MNGHALVRRSIPCGLAGAAVLLATMLAGCETEGPSDVRSYTDSAGRSCTVDISDISLTATCDADPSALVSCEADQEPAFVVNQDYDFDTRIYTLRSCAACVDRAAQTTYVGDACATVECTTDDDCLNHEGSSNPYTCTGGICTND